MKTFWIGTWRTVVWKQNVLDFMWVIKMKGSIINIELKSALPEELSKSLGRGAHYWQVS